MIRVMIFKCSLAAIAVIFLAAAVGYAQGLDTLRLEAEADSLKAKADSLWEISRIDEALPLYQTALADYQQIGDKASEAQVFGDIGQVYAWKWKFNDALSNFESRLSLERELGNRRGEAEALLSLGNAHVSLLQFSATEEAYYLALRISQELGDRHLKASAADALAAAHFITFEYDSVLTWCNLALKISQEIGDGKTEAEVLAHLGEAYLCTSDLTRALDCEKKSLQLYQELGNVPRQSFMLFRMGFMSSCMGDESRALEYYQQALELSSQIDDSIRIARLLRAMGMSCHNNQEYGKALQFYQQALRLSETLSLNDDVMLKENVRACNMHLGRLYRDLAEFDKALPYFTKALNMAKELNIPATEAMTLEELGDFYFKRGNYAYAMSYHQAALAIWHRIRLPESPETYLGMAKCYAAQEQDSAAIAYYEKATAIAEVTRGRLQMESSKSLFAAYVSTVYENLILTLLKSSRSGEAFDYAERGRARSFLDLLAAGQVKVARPRHREFLANESRYQKEKLKVEEQIAAAGDDSAQVAVLRGRLEGEWGQTLKLIEEKKQEEPELASLVSVNPLTLPEVQKLLDKETTLLEYFLTEKRTLIWLVTRNKAEAFQVEIGGDSLKSLVMAFRKAIEIEDRTDSLSRQLYDLLIAPAAEKIKTENLVVVPHGILHYLPFAALQDHQGRFLLDDYKLSYLPSASVLKYLEPKRRSRGQALLALGNPTGGGAEYTPLPLAAAEAQQVAALYPHSRVLTGEQATEETFKRSAPEYDILHLACHGDLNSAYPMYSGLLLALGSEEDGKLQVHEIFNLELSASLVVLSGCQTGLGHLTTGDELVGLSRAFIYAGTPSVLSSLWMVEDRSTAYLMSRFYRHLRSAEKAEALRLAQQETRAKFSELHAWAPFVLIGDDE